ncbi:uncharacterized protein LOC113273486 [Papaver somniferum]|uniref:uncharacterized protein LOC113273486 n=1 Tax=Papaver somniferum TaxID=3469 RepID=UPI000E7053AE|nr:uncharacterized protein LOC113273486 [Papaver somniferum]
MAASSLGMRCGNTFLFQKAEVKVKTRLRWLTEAQSTNVLLHRHHLKFNKQACSISKIGRSIRAAVGSSSAAYLDTDLELVRHKLEKQQRRDNAVRENKVEVCQEQAPPISAEKLHEWMTYSVSEIVKNISEMPLLVHIYSSKDKGGISPVGSPLTAIPIPIIEEKKADPDIWVGVTRRWEEGNPVPDGIILVEQLNVDNDSYNGIKVETPNMTNFSSSNTTTWGVVIQGRGVHSASSCYILKTCRIGSLLGFCTHFCLIKAKCFGEIADLQLKNSWLLSQLNN